MADWPITTPIRIEGMTARTRIAQSGVAAHTKTAYTTLITSTAFDATGILINVYNANDARALLVDIAVGAAAAEQVIIPDLALGGVIRAGGVVHIPIAVPAGSRISARFQVTGTFSNGVDITVNMTAGALTTPGTYSRMVAYGVSTATSLATQIDPGATANTYSAWVQLTAATTADHRAFIGVANVGASSTNPAAQWLVDVAVGASGQEQVILSSMFVVGLFGATLAIPGIWPVIPADIPEGSRLAVRAKCDANGSPARLLYVALYGLS